LSLSYCVYLYIRDISKRSARDPDSCRLTLITLCWRKRIHSRLADGIHVETGAYVENLPASSDLNGVGAERCGSADVGRGRHLSSIRTDLDIREGDGRVVGAVEEYYDEVLALGSCSEV